MSKVEPRHHIIDRELTTGTIDAWKQALGLSRTAPAKSLRCDSCDAVSEEWWNYCARCGYHIASGSLTEGDGQNA
jgi:hypothetical protein